VSSTSGSSSKHRKRDLRVVAEVVGGVFVVVAACVTATATILSGNFESLIGLLPTEVGKVALEPTLAPEVNVQPTTTTVVATALPTLTPSSVSGGVMTVLIVSQLTGWCLDVPLGTSRDTIVTQYGCHGDVNQQWQLVDVGSGFHLLQSIASSKCLSVPDSSLEDNAGVVQAECHGGDNQMWQLIQNDAAFQIVAKHSGKCLDILGGRNDGLVIQYTCHEADSQMWSLLKVPAE